MGTIAGRRVVDWLRHRWGFVVRGVYDTQDFWNKAYAHGRREPFEWAGVGLDQLYEYEFKDVSIHRPASGGMRASLATDVPLDARVLLLGSGTSLLGRHMVSAGWRGGITQLDFAEVVVFDREDGLEWVLGDARALDFDGGFDAVVDKGTVDAIYLSSSDAYARDVASVVRGAARALEPKTGVFMVFSLSDPRYMWPLLVDPTTAPFWDPHTSEVRRLPSIYVYLLRRSSRRIPRGDIRS